MRFEISVVSVLFLLTAMTACGTPTEDDPGEDMGRVTCPEGQVVSPISGECVTPRRDMGTDTSMDMTVAQDMPGTQPDMPGVQPDLGGADMSCAEGQIFNPITGTCVDEVTGDMGEDLGGMDMGQDMAEEADMATPQDMGGDFGVLYGNITRSADPQNGGIGPVFVALFERNPVTAGGSDPGVVAFQRIDNVDFNPAGVMVPYRLEGIPPRADQYYIVAFLDDNMSADTTNPQSAGPDRGDLLTLDGIGPVTVTVSAPGEQLLDLDLNFSMIF